MKNKVKGFTLTECIVAMAILAVASLTMAQIYASVATKNKMNNLVNTSLSNQMQYVEKYTNAEAVEIAFTGSTSTTTPPHKGGSSQYMQVAKLDASGTPAVGAGVYSYPVDIYVLKSRNRDDQTLNKNKEDFDRDEQGFIISDVGNTAGYGESDYNLRYKYLLGHTS